MKCLIVAPKGFFVLTKWGAFDSAKNHKRQRRKRQSVTAKREKSQTPKFVYVRLGQASWGSFRLG